MPGIGLVHRRGDHRADIESVHVAIDLSRRHRWIRKRDVEIRLRGVSFKGAGGVHAGEGGGAHERRRFFDDGLDVGRNGDDVMRADEADQIVEGGAEGVEKLIGRGMILAQLFENLARIFVRIEFGGNLFEVFLIFPQVGPADFEQLAERHVYHLVILELFLECVGADAKVAV